MSQKQNGIINLMGNIGLTHNESIVLLELYKGGSFKADHIADLTAKHISRIYEALESLINKGFVKMNDTRPRIYAAVNPRDAFFRYITQIKIQLKNQIELIERSSNELIEIIEPIYYEGHTDILPVELLSQFNDLEEATKYTNKLINQAEKEILIFSHVFNWFDQVRESLEAAIQRNCKVRVLMQSSLQEVNRKIDRMTELGIEVKHAPSKGLMSRGTIVDNKTMIFIIWAGQGEFAVSNDEGETKPRRIYKPHYSTNPGVVEVFKGYFNHLWEKH